MGKAQALAVIRTPGLIKTGRAEYDRAIQVFNAWNAGGPLDLESVKLFFEELKAGRIKIPALIGKNGTVRQKAKPYKPSTIALFKVGIKKALSASLVSHQDWLALDKFFKEELKRSKKGNKKTVKPQKFLTAAEVKAIIKHKKCSKRTGAMIRFLFGTGMRISEALDLRHTDYDGETLEIRFGKGEQPRDIQVAPDLIALVNDAFGGKEFLFENKNGKAFSRRYWFKAISEAGLDALGKHIHPHMLRHSFAMDRKETHPIDEVSRELGHSSVSITMDMYCHGRMTQEDARNDFNRFEEL